MASRSARNNKKTSKTIIDNEVNLVSARTEANKELRKLSRSKSADSYAQLRAKRTRKKNVLVGVVIVLASLLVAGSVAVAANILILQNNLVTDSDGTKHDFSTGVYENTFVAPEPKEPFWMLLLGTDERDDGVYPRADTIILARIDTENRTAVLVSIPRDTYATIPGFGEDKINAAYSLGEQAHAQYLAGTRSDDHTGPELMIETVKQFAGVDIAYFAKVNFDGFVQLVDDVGGVEVNVPVDIVGDYHVAYTDVYAGQQVLDGEHALAFVRSRNFAIGDYQRQANQRTFLQAFARTVLDADLPTIATTVTNLSNMTLTNMPIADIVNVAQCMKGMQETDIYTYAVPSYPDMIDAISFVICEDEEWRALITALNNGQYPELQSSDLAGVSPDDYQAGSAQSLDRSTGSSDVNASQYVIDVRNGYGIVGSATSVSDMLTLAGYQRGEVGNTNSFVYEETLIIYKTDADQVAAEDIHRRLGYGRVVSSQDRYTFGGNVLVVVGGDFPTSG
ncbi:MAG: LCP family protein [Coriobacteriales bacterium]|jgi:LCP family protein required for cell wall assembly|nr:LCP family protein [Coriobacteriales bacterium]